MMMMMMMMMMKSIFRDQGVGFVDVINLPVEGLILLRLSICMSIKDLRH